jgi:hypothetical protein
MRRGSIITRYQKPRFRTTGRRSYAERPRPYRRSLGDDPVGGGITIPVTFPMVVTGAVVVSAGMLFWHVMSEASKVYRKPRLQ